MLMGIYGTGGPSLHNIAKFIQDDTSTKRPVNVYTVIRRDNLAEEVEKMKFEQASRIK
ncbi:hypothetical protein MASR1M36_17130 [Candidatus Cloacimonadaceae bacterium]